MNHKQTKNDDRSTLAAKREGQNAEQLRSVLVRKERRIPAEG